MRVCWEKLTHPLAHVCTCWRGDWLWVKYGKNGDCVNRFRHYILCGAFICFNFAVDIIYYNIYPKKITFPPAAPRCRFIYCEYLQNFTDK